MAPAKSFLVDLSNSANILTLPVLKSKRGFRLKAGGLRASSLWRKLQPCVGAKPFILTFSLRRY